MVELKLRDMKSSQREQFHKNVRALVEGGRIAKNMDRDVNSRIKD